MRGVDAAHAGRRIGQAEYDRLVESGALDGVDVEYLEGVLVDVRPQGERHARMIMRLNGWLAPVVAKVRVQMPLAAGGQSRPEPDIAVLSEADAASEELPATAQLVVEVADTSQLADRAKADLYAAAGVARYWIVDLPAACVVEHLDPSEDGYGHTHTLRFEDVLEPRVEGVEPRSVQDLLSPRG